MRATMPFSALALGPDLYANGRRVYPEHLQPDRITAKRPLQNQTTWSHGSSEGLVKYKVIGRDFAGKGFIVHEYPQSNLQKYIISSPLYVLMSLDQFPFEYST